MNPLVSETQRQLSQWAINSPTEQRRELYSLMYRDVWIRQAHDTVKQHAGSMTAGCDGMTMERFDAHLEEHLQKLKEELKTQTFAPSPVRRVYIPKDSRRTKWRPLGIPSLRDRIVQEALRMILEPIYEADFNQYSFGFRPNRCTMDAIKCLTWSTQEHKKYFWVIEGDISSYFDTIHHRKLVKLLRRRIADEQVIQLLWRFLKAGVMERKLFHETPRGTPQGGICSPLLANVYLHELDMYMERYTALSTKEKTIRRKMGLSNFVYIRYADDFVVLGNGTHRQAKELKQELKQYLQEELFLTLSEEKTKITHLNDGFKFLGFWIQRKKGHAGITTKVTIPKEAVDRIKDKIAQTTDTSTYVHSTNAKIVALNRLIGGWCRYYQYTSEANTVFNKIGYYAFWKVAHWLARKYQISIKTVMKRYYENSTFATDDYTLIRVSHLKTKHYKKRFLKPNPYVEQVERHRETLPSEIEWTGQEVRPGAMDLRAHILRRDNYTCQICGTRYEKAWLEVDHVKPVWKFTIPSHADVPENLRTLCVKHHKEKTQHDRQVESRMR